MVIQGSTSGSIKSDAIPIAGLLTSIAVYNKTGGSIVVKMGVVISETDRYLFSFNLAAMGSATSSGYQETKIMVQPTNKILIVTSGECDYYLTILPPK